jgi:hypothetical protein
MVIYAANPDTLVSPTVIIALASVVWFLSLADVSIDFAIRRYHRGEME